MTRSTKPNRSVETDVRIKRLVVSEPVHARSADLDINFVDVIGINIGGRQSPSMSDIDLLADISLGAIPFRVESRGYELSLRCVRIILEKENASVQPGTYYKMVLQPGHYEASGIERAVSKRAVGGEATAGAEASVGLLAAVPVWTAKVFGKASAKAEAGHTIESTVINKSVQTLELVYHSGQETWVAGGPEGDPRRETTRDLRGEIVGGEGDLPTPLCGLEAADHTLPVSGRLRVRAGIEGFAINGGQTDEATLDRLFESLESDQRYALKRRVRAENDLRARVAALAMLRDNRKPRISELDLAVRSFAFEPDLVMNAET